MSRAAIGEAEIELVLDYLNSTAGLAFPRTRRTELGRGIQRAMERIRASSIDEFLECISADASKRDLLLSEMTVGETYFFREPAQFQFIRDHVVPGLLDARPGRSINAWSAGCAAGEEAYSLAILFNELGLGSRSSVLGTDIARDRLARAARARFTRWSLRGVPDETIERHFMRRGSGFQLAAELRRAVEFRQLNLARDSYPEVSAGQGGPAGMDLILCRNVLIYMDPATISRVVERLILTLSDDGWLFLGASDPAIVALTPCEVVVTPGGVAYRRNNSVTMRSAAPAPPRFVPQLQQADDSGDAPEPGYDRPPHRAGALAIPDAEPMRSEAEEAAEVRRLANAGHLNQAARVCASALERYGTSAELVHLEAVLLASAQRYREAAAAARRALYLDAGMIVAHVALADALGAAGDVRGAARALRNALRLLDGMQAGDVVPGSDGEQAEHLAALTRLRLRQVEEAIA